MKSLLYTILLLFPYSLYSLEYKPIYNAQPLKKEALLRLTRNLIDYDLKDLMEKIERKEIPQELIDSIKRELIHENLLLYVDIFNDLIEPQKTNICSFEELRFNSDETQLLGVRESKVVLYTWPSLEAIKTIDSPEFPSPQGRILSAALIPNTNFLIIAYEKKICFWDLRQNVCIKEIKKDTDTFCNIVISKTGKNVILRCEPLFDENSVKYYQLPLTQGFENNLKHLCTTKALSWYKYLGFAPNEEYLIELKENSIFYCSPKPFFREINLDKEGCGMALSSDGSQLFALICSGKEGYLYKYDFRKGSKVIEPLIFKTPAPMYVIALSPDDRFCITVDIERNIWLCTNSLSRWVKLKKAFPLECTHLIQWLSSGTILIQGINLGEGQYLPVYAHSFYETIDQLLTIKELILIAKLNKDGSKILNNPYYNVVLEQSTYYKLLASYFGIENNCKPKS